MANDQVQTEQQPEPTGEEQEIDHSQNSQDNVNEGKTDELASYEDEVAEMKRGEEPAQNDNESSNNEESEGVEGEKEFQDDQTSNEETEDESTEESQEQSEDNKGEDAETDKVDVAELSKRRRLKAKSDKDKLAFDIYQRNEDLEMEDCIKLADAQLNPNKDSDEAKKDDEPSAVEALETELDELSAKQAKHIEEYETDEAGEVGIQIKDLNKKIRKAEREELKAELTQTINEESVKQRFEANHETSAQEAVALYPDLNDEDSSLYELASMYLAQMGMDNPDNSPNLPLEAAQKAAKMLKVDPKGKTVAQQAQPQQKQPQRPVIPPQRGNAKTSQPINPASKLDEAVDGVNSTEDYDALVAEMENG